MINRRFFLSHLSLACASAALAGNLLFKELVPVPQPVEAYRIELQVSQYSKMIIQVYRNSYLGPLYKLTTVNHEDAVAFNEFIANAQNYGVCDVAVERNECPGII